jgi:uncharacterized membrane protein
MHKLPPRSGLPNDPTHTQWEEGATIGAAAGGLTGALIGLGIPEHEAKFFNEEIERGGILVGVYTHEDRASQARKIMDAAGAERVK